ncbi:MAG: PadR family transcriptional regulator [Longimicrobiales bacterium]
MGGSDGSLPLFKGTLDLLVLKALSFGPQHGYGITTWLESRSDGSIDVDDSALYQALHRLAGRRLVEAEWGVSDNNRRARFYTLTARGRGALREESDTWERYVASVGAILARESR